MKDACDEKVAEKIETCSQHPDFVKLSASQLARILKREDLCVSREEAVFKGIFTWLSISKDRHAFLGNMWISNHFLLRLCNDLDASLSPVPVVTTCREKLLQHCTSERESKVQTHFSTDLGAASSIARFGRS